MLPRFAIPRFPIKAQFIVRHEHLLRLHPLPAPSQHRLRGQPRKASLDDGFGPFHIPSPSIAGLSLYRSMNYKSVTKSEVSEFHPDRRSTPQIVLNSNRNEIEDSTAFMKSLTHRFLSDLQVSRHILVRAYIGPGTPGEH